MLFDFPRGLLLLKAGTGRLVEDTATGNPLTFNTNVAKPLKSLLIPFTPTQTGTGDPSPENVRPIVGLTGLTAWRTGKNLVQFPYDDGGSKYTKGITFTVLSDGGISISGESNDVCYYNMVGSTKKVLLKAGTYSKKLPSDSNVQFNIYKNDMGTAQSISAGNNTKFTLSEDTYVFYYLRVANGVNFSTPVVVYPQIEVGEESTDYETPTGESYPVDWTTEAGTVYGGTLDLVSGVLTVDKGVVVFDGDIGENWLKNTTYNYFYNETEIPDAINANASADTFVSSIFPYGNITNNNATLGACLIWRHVRVRLADMSISLDDFRAMLEETPMQVVYSLATPRTIQLDPVTVNALVGDNTVWSDTNGENTAAYLKKA